ncbi:MAG: glycosyltransferase [Anaerolineae bacterium]
MISHTPHYRTAAGEIVGYGPTVRELDALGAAVHIAPLHPDPPPPSARPYSTPLTYIPVEPAGGDRLRDKLAVLARIPGWARTIRREARRAGMLHIRCPAAISLVALAVTGGRAWIKYAGSWAGYPGEPLATRIQRVWLRIRRRAVVTTNSPSCLPHVHTLPNPCLSTAELATARHIAAGRTFEPPVRVLYAGRLTPEKGIGRALAVLARLDGALLDVAGGGDLAHWQAHAASLGIGARVTFHGELPRADLDRLYARAHLLLLPSRSEGWPKVLAEAMAFGVVPVVSDTGAVPHTLDGVGICLPYEDIDGFAAAVRAYDAARWQAESGRAAQMAERFTYEAYTGMLWAILS